MQIIILLKLFNQFQYGRVIKVRTLYSVYKLLPSEESLCKQTLPLKTNVN